MGRLKSPNAVHPSAESSAAKPILTLTHTQSLVGFRVKRDEENRSPSFSLLISTTLKDDRQACLSRYPLHTLLHYLTYFQPANVINSRLYIPYKALNMNIDCSSTKVNFTLMATYNANHQNINIPAAQTTESHCI